MSNSKDHFAAAAVRHYTDSKYLLQHDRRDNAMCHLAFSAECVLKAFWEGYHKKFSCFRNVKAVHSEEKLMDFLQDYYWLTIKNPCYAFLTDMESIPSELFEDHPERRYFEDQNYNDSIIELSLQYVQSLIQRMLECALDGQLIAVSQ